ncbi:MULTISPECIES: HEPN domain-containing protein [Xanthomonas]|uniref:HEPN domain-containing protein n=2 Tax=Xanthomonas TaxID=338 RepID=A0A7Z7NHW6_XANCH|nr:MULTISPECIES: HEPN domain-containing protein [Xanthomonas]ATS38525.1 HEPN domain-containing protein [Xanthomonas citri pv. phaseoli var. fuscans]ATS42674.1 HEPN domain-containing protein [Xanthomonas citri pv. phaseoli var. fuscans]ATS46525.1 HEPN domain-containing protein [Xanthomonas citri pv. phaseoli var. fuscans]ATS83216.1 HEPN domain-containing protein [Xanthomonas citri pv. phaseoli var. fuscans]QWN20182.1 HEPN domain-containing protein [Xanthomonas citri]
MNAEWNAPPKPESDHDFDQMMMGLDEHFNALDLHIHQRPGNAAIFIAQTYGKGQKIILFGGDPSSDSRPFSAAWLSQRAHSWYERRYGEDIKVLPSLGFFIIPLEHRAWKVRAPYSNGRLHLVCNRLLHQGEKENIISSGHIDVNMLDCFEGMTQSYADTLDEKALVGIASRFLLGLNALTFLDAPSQSDDPLFRQARADYNHSVEALTSIERSYGKARRDTATCAEKIMKGLLAGKGLSFKSNHELVKLAQALNDQGDLHVDLELASLLYTDASVSYGKAVSKEEALAAHANLLRFLSELLAQVFGRP